MANQTVNSTNKLPKMYDLDMWTTIGINPFTGLPIRVDGGVDQ